MVSARRAGAALVATALLSLTACSSGGDAPKHKAPANALNSYVAMGDSSVAGPGINPLDLSSGGCQRSQKNWPTLLAKTLHIRGLRDVSCGGAVSTDITQARTSSNAVQPQIDALSASTDLVTITIGGNDEGLFTKTIVSCLAGKYDAHTCTSFIDTKLDGIVARTTTRVASVLASIKARAPKARIIAVGYLHILPAKGGCALPGLAPARTDLAVKGMNGMNDALKAAAERAGVEFVPIAGVSAGHEACSSTAWVNGMKAVPGDGAFLHPNEVGMRAIAKAVAAQVEHKASNAS